MRGGGFGEGAIPGYVVGRRAPIAEVLVGATLLLLFRDWAAGSFTSGWLLLWRRAGLARGTTAIVTTDVARWLGLWLRGHERRL